MLLDKNRLRWAVRRGMLELDLILAPFLDNVYDQLPTDEQQMFQDLLECEDQDLFNWLLDKHEPHADHQRMVEIILANTGLQICKDEQ